MTLRFVETAAKGEHRLTFEFALSGRLDSRATALDLCAVSLWRIGLPDGYLAEQDPGVLTVVPPPIRHIRT